MTAILPEWTRAAFSDARLAPYLRLASGDGAAALLLYWWNVEVSAAFYGPLHCLEVSLRNALHDQLRTAYGRDDWWTPAPLADNGRRMIADAGRKCHRHGPRPSRADDMVAELPFGFWVSLISEGRSYDRTLWVPTLHRAFPTYRGRRDVLHDNMRAMALLRNRIMHHEPIHHRDLLADHRKIFRLLGYISPDAAREAQALDRVPAVLDRRIHVCGGAQPPRF